MSTMKQLAKRLQKKVAALWSATVKTHWRAPAGLFKKPAGVVAQTLLNESKDAKQAISRLNFYVNRAGKNLSQSDKSRLRTALVMLHPSGYHAARESKVK